MTAFNYYRHFFKLVCLKSILIKTEGRTNGQTDGRTKRGTERRTNGRTNGRTDGRSDGRTDGRTDGRRQAGRQAGNHAGRQPGRHLDRHTDIIACALASVGPCCLLRPYIRVSIPADSSSFRNVSMPAGGGLTLIMCISCLPFKCFWSIHVA